MKLLCKKCLLQINPLICPSEIHVMHYACVVIKTSLFLYSKYLKQESEDKRGKDLDISEWTLRSKRRVVSFFAIVVILKRLVLDKKLQRHFYW